MPDHTHVLLATLGGQPQVVTFTLDLLLQRKIPIREVIVIHPALISHEKLQHSIACLRTEFTGNYYKRDGQNIRFSTHTLKYYEQPVDDIVDEQTADGTLDTMDELIRSLKQQQYIVHFSITGGRRLMSFLSFSAALLNFEPADRLWHIYTPEVFQEQARNGAIMHASLEDNVRLIEIPFARSAQPILSHILSTSNTSTRTFIRSQNEQRETEEGKRRKQVKDAASPAEQRVLQAFAQGLHPKEVAVQLNISELTVSSHTNVLLRLCRNAWNIKDKERLDYRFLQIQFANYPSDNE